MAATKTGIKVPDSAVADVEAKEKEDAKVKAEPKKPTLKKFQSDDLISVRSITQGELLLPGKKSGILYRWAGAGDIRDVEYGDLYSLKSTRSRYLYDPLIIIENENLLNDPKWADIKKAYDLLYDAQDMDEILNLPPQQFESLLRKLPQGYLNSIKIEVSTRIDDGSFDSITKIKIVDRICGSDLMSLVK